MTFQRYIETISEKTFPHGTSKEELDRYTREVMDRLVTHKSGARTWGPLAISPEGNEKIITPEQSVDYKIPRDTYTMIGRGAESIAYINSNKTKVVKLVRNTSSSRSHTSSGVIIEEPEDIIEQRFRKCGVAKNVDKLPPIEIPDTSKFFMHYSDYKNKKDRGEPVELPEGVVYSKDAKGFAFVDRFAFVSLSLECLPNGIMLQDHLPEDGRKMTKKEAFFITKFMEANGVHVDKFNPYNNIFIGTDNIYVID